MDFEKFTKSIELYSAGFNAGNSCALKYKGKSIFEKGTYSRGLNVFAIFGDEVLLKECFDTWASRDESERFHDKIKKLPDGAFVAIVVCDEAATNLTQSAVDAIKMIGGNGTVYGRYRAAYYCLGQKGMKGGAIESDNRSEGPIYYPESAKNNT